MLGESKNEESNHETSANVPLCRRTRGSTAGAEGEVKCALHQPGPKSETENVEMREIRHMYLQTARA